MHARFQWYSDNQAVIRPGTSWTGNLLSFVDINESSLPSGLSARTPVLIQFADYHIQINSAKKFNSGSAGNGLNHVIINKERNNWSQTWEDWLLEEGQKATVEVEGGPDMTVEVCTLDIGRVDHATLSIYPAGESSGCPSNNGGSNGGDPTCSTGIRSSHNMCCAASCLSCGGAGCNKRDGGADNCCNTQIRDSGVSCLTNPPPCVI